MMGLQDLPFHPRDVTQWPHRGVCCIEKKALPVSPGDLTFGPVPKVANTFLFLDILRLRLSALGPFNFSHVYQLSNY